MPNPPTRSPISSTQRPSRRYRTKARKHTAHRARPPPERVEHPPRLCYTALARRSGRVVEGGTLLRCYTSQRGIEGSNPSSSAPKVPRLQEQRSTEVVGRERSRPLLHQRVHQRGSERRFQDSAASIA